MVELLLIAAFSAASCSFELANTEYCAALDNGGVTLEGNLTSPGGPGGESDGTVTIQLPDSVNDPFANCEVVVDGRCQTVGSGPEAPPAPITLADIAHLVPSAGDLAMQPNGWTVLRLPINPISTASTHVASTTLLGALASVRFTPVEWQWDYGDGAVGSSATGGARWEAFGLREFDPTPTSHAYRSRGTYLLSVSVVMRAEYRIGEGPWVGIPGALSVAGPSREVVVASSTTVLVDEDCRSNPRGPGC